MTQVSLGKAKYSELSISYLVDAFNSTSRISGYTHKFYNYPARFAPEFAEAAIKVFTDVDDTVIDPFLGGGTTLTEARLNGRRFLGTDLNELSLFVSKIKNTQLSASEAKVLRNWCKELPNRLNLHNTYSYIKSSKENTKYKQNLYSRNTWPTRKLLEISLESIDQLEASKLQNYARGILLKTGQWALDGKKHIPSADKIRNKLVFFGHEMIDASILYTKKVREINKGFRDQPNRSLIKNVSAEYIPNYINLVCNDAPKLILTSPPYPGVHVLYHRWQVNGGKETAAPYWITGKSDGLGASYYTFGDRKNKELESYFFNLEKIFRSIREIVSEDTIILQLIAFSNSDWQLRRYLETMGEAGFKEYKLRNFSSFSDGRLWRSVPNRKWHAAQKGFTHSSKEVVLFHKVK